MAVHVAARIMAAAGAGEILTSRTVRDLMVGSDVALEPRGFQPLKGIEGSSDLFIVSRA
jgi:class 3 adenylate cyclase